MELELELELQLELELYELPSLHQISHTNFFFFSRVVGGIHWLLSLVLVFKFDPSSISSSPHQEIKRPRCPSSFSFNIQHTT
jgi:hypothetical protein